MPIPSPAPYLTTGLGSLASLGSLATLVPLPPPFRLRLSSRGRQAGTGTHSIATPRGVVTRITVSGGPSRLAQTSQRGQHRKSKELRRFKR
jgi:hypothetical protein